MSTRCGSRCRALVAWWDAAPWRRSTHPNGRCIMGWPVADYAHCRRPAAHDDSLWCRHHRRWLARQGWLREDDDALEAARGEATDG